MLVQHGYVAKRQFRHTALPVHQPKSRRATFTFSRRDLGVTGTLPSGRFTGIRGVCSAYCVSRRGNVYRAENSDKSYITNDDNRCGIDSDETTLQRRQETIYISPKTLTQGRLERKIILYTTLARERKRNV